MKKYLYSIVFATMILLSTTAVKASNEVYYINDQNIEMTKKEYNNLLGLGFTEKQIARMEEEEFINNKDLEGTILSEKKQYIKTTTVVRNGIAITTSKEITEEEAMAEKELQSQQPSKGPSGNYYDGMIADSVLVLTSKIVGISNTYMRFKADNDWLVIPSQRYYDVIGIGMESNKVEFGSTIVFREDWMKTDNTTGYTTVCSPKSVNTGGLAIFKLPNGSLQSLESTIYFNVKKKSGVGTITSLYATGDYAHATSNVNPNNLLSNISISVTSGLMIGGSYTSYYQGTPEAVASFIGTW